MRHWLGEIDLHVVVLAAFFFLSGAALPAVAYDPYFASTTLLITWGPVAATLVIPQGMVWTRYLDERAADHADAGRYLVANQLFLVAACALLAAIRVVRIFGAA